MGSGLSKPSTAPTLYIAKQVRPESKAVLMTTVLARINLNVKIVNISKEDQHGEAFKAINPDHKLPTLVDGSLTLWESRAIQQYLLDRYTPDHSLYPQDPVKRAPINRIIQYEIVNFAPAVVEYVMAGISKRPEKLGRVALALDYIEKLLEKSKHLCSDQISIADLSVLAHVDFLAIVNFRFDRWPNVRTWMHSLHTKYFPSALALEN